MGRSRAIRAMIAAGVTLGVFVVTMLAPALATGSGGGQRAAAQVVSTPDTYTVVARADGLVIETITPKLPLVATGGGLVEVSTSSAQAKIDSIGQSTSFAGAPYPGDIVVGLPGLVNGLGAGKLPPVPDYPLYVSADFPSEPSGRAEFGPYVLEASSDDLMSAARVESGVLNGEPQVLGIVATADSYFDEADGSLVAEARTTTNALALSSLIKIGSIESHARMVRDAEGEISLESSVDFGTLTIAGVKIGITDEGLVLGVPVPGLGPKVITGLLASVGLNIEIVPAVQTETSYTTAGLRFQTEADVPTQGMVKVAVILGRSTVSIDAIASSAPDPGELGPDLGAAPPQLDTPVAPSASEDFLPSDTPTPSLGEGSGTEVAAPAPGPTPVAGIRSLQDIDLGGTQFYVALVIAAAIGLATSRALGVFGIQTPPPEAVSDVPRLRLDQL